jgi:hypothetical protein
MQRTALRAAADAERYADPLTLHVSLMLKYLWSLLSEGFRDTSEIRDRVASFSFLALPGL